MAAVFGVKNLARSREGAKGGQGDGRVLDMIYMMNMIFGVGVGVGVGDWPSVGAWGWVGAAFPGTPGGGLEGSRWVTPPVSGPVWFAAPAGAGEGSLAGARPSVGA